MEDNCHDRSLRQPPSAGHNPYLGSLRSLARSPGPALCARSPRAASAHRSAQLLFLIARSSHFTGRPCARAWHGLQLGLVPRLPRRSLAPPLARPTINPLLREAVSSPSILFTTPVVTMSSLIILAPSLAVLLIHAKGSKSYSMHGEVMHRAYRHSFDLLIDGSPREEWVQHR